MSQRSTCDIYDAAQSRRKAIALTIDDAHPLAPQHLRKLRLLLEEKRYPPTQTLLNPGKARHRSGLFDRKPTTEMSAFYDPYRGV